MFKNEIRKKSGLSFHILTCFLLLTSCTVYGQEKIENLANAFIKVESGEFIMGSNKGRENEKPARKVVISEQYELGKYEVTQKFWCEIMGTTPADQLEALRKDLGKPNYQDLRGIGDDYPMYLVSWNEVQLFLSKLNAKSTKYNYRLPTEAEWEYAARAGTETLYSFGDNESELSEYGWYIKNANYNTHPVGMKKPNPWGIYDMHGNVYEWVQDRADDSTSDRIMKGGSWGNTAKSSHSARRTINSPTSRSRGLGFRLVRFKK